MKNYQKSDSVLCQDIGARIRAHRVQQNWTQTQLAQEIGCTEKTLSNLETGKGKLQTLVAALRALNLLDQLDLFVPVAEISPLELLKNKGVSRQRAYHHPNWNVAESDSEW